MKMNQLLDEEFILLSAPMVEMANLSSKDTGLSYVIWFGEVGGQHGPRIKVSNIKGKFATNDNFVISVAREPQVLTPRSRKISNSDLEDVFDWVKLNYDTLMKLWNAFKHDEPTISLLADLVKL